MKAMPVYIKTAAELKGAAWAARYPGKADELYVVARSGKKRTTRRFGPPTDKNREAAERKRDEWAAALERTDLSSSGIVAPLLDDAIRDFERKAMISHAWKTREVRKYQLAKIVRILGSVTLDKIDADRVIELWDSLLGDYKLAERTAHRHLDALSKVFQWHELPNPVPEARIRIKKKTPKTAKSRALDSSNCKPVAMETMAKLLPRLSGDLLTTVLLCYEMGLRIGEATGVRWEDITFGSDENDTSRSILIQRARVGNRKGNTKSGLSRRVAFSRRMRNYLMAKFMEAGRPARGWVVEQSWHSNIHDRLEKAAKVAKVEKPNFKDFRDTYASTLITHGIVLKWISLQLGHASVSVTERHYARYMAVDGYQNPWVVPDGCLPSDLLETLDGWRHQGSTQRHHGLQVAEL
jgi:integrase